MAEQKLPKLETRVRFPSPAPNTRIRQTIRGTPRKVENNMDIAAFKASAEADVAPDGLSLPLLALWHLAKGDWEEAHRQVQEDKNIEGAWVHAHLHRVEGDLPNARYWYQRAGRDASTAPLDQECKEITAALLADT